MLGEVEERKCSKSGGQGKGLNYNTQKELQCTLRVPLTCRMALKP